MAMRKGWLGQLAVPGAELAVRVVPGAGRDAVVQDDDGTLRVRVTAAPENGKANKAVCVLLAKALGIPKSRLTLIRGATAREKVFRVEE